jgi:predicted flavoprotein YhiN
MRVFPQSNKSTDIVDMFQKIISAGDCKIHFSESAVSLKSHVISSEVEKSLRQSKFTLVTDKATYDFDYVVITTG